METTYSREHRVQGLGRPGRGLGLQGKRLAQFAPQLLLSVELQGVLVFR